ncbi:MAG: hypothetical protein ACTHN5_10030 [Phycisphaerae bacterium]
MAGRLQVVRWALAMECGLRVGEAATGADEAFEATMNARRVAQCLDLDKGGVRGVCVTGSSPFERPRAVACDDWG